MILIITFYFYAKKSTQMIWFLSLAYGMLRQNKTFQDTHFQHFCHYFLTLSQTKWLMHELQNCASTSDDASSVEPSDVSGFSTSHD